MQPLIHYGSGLSQLDYSQIETKLICMIAMTAQKEATHSRWQRSHRCPFRAEAVHNITSPFSGMRFVITSQCNLQIR